MRLFPIVLFSFSAIGLVADEMRAPGSGDAVGATAPGVFAADESIDQLRALAEKGDPAAQCRLGFAIGMAGDQSTKEAVSWFERAAEQGVSVAQYIVGLAYISGNGVPQDAVEGMKWIRGAADQGFARAELEIGRAYAFGNRVSVNEKEGMRWVRKAAERGLADAQLLLGVAYAGGRGVQADEAEALRWLQSAADQGHDVARATLARLYPMLH